MSTDVDSDDTGHAEMLTVDGHSSTASSRAVQRLYFVHRYITQWHCEYHFFKNKQTRSLFSSIQMHGRKCSKLVGRNTSGVTVKTRHRASTRMYSLTFCVRVMSPERHHWKPAVQAAAVMLRTPPSTASHRPASLAHLRYTARNVENASVTRRSLISNARTPRVN